MRNLNGYTSFFAEAQAKQRIHKQTRQSGERNSNKAHKEYLAHIYADRTPRDYERVKQALSLGLLLLNMIIRKVRHFLSKRKVNLR